jgi:hypothetical protein
MASIWASRRIFSARLSRAKSWDVMHEVFRRARSFKAPKPFTVASFHALPRATATSYIRVAPDGQPH